ncbi:uncharacterized protein LOC116619211 [Nematostella vectensis]|uniref:uncharacterized protein LOC116619211 n=1 Tax=Nematostella vectensis TaxID=45351 RepID=UPI00138FBF3A|nr:uncharacterized protein LOC116619211 [Nematostella vectensis]
MRKAVTLVKSLLKRHKIKKDEQEGKDGSIFANRPKLPEITILRPCPRCVIAYENKIRKPQRGETAENELGFTDSDDLPYDEGKAGRNLQGFLKLHGLNQGYDRESSSCADESCMSLWGIRGHILWKQRHRMLDLRSHCPILIIMTETSTAWKAPLFYKDRELTVLRSSLRSLISLLGINIQFNEFSPDVHIDVWITFARRNSLVVFSDQEDMLVQGVLDHFVWIAFCNVPLSCAKRAEHIEALFQAVDHIIDMSIYLLKTGSEPSEISNTVKEAIIETATIVTSTAAESTATVGIETAAMALGQAAAGVAISVLVDVAITAGTVTHAKIKRDKGLISNKEFKTTVRHKLCDSGCQFIGGTTGTIVGQVLIPVPVVGAIVGGFCGSLIGAGVSKGIIKTSEIISRAQASKAKAITDK